jgi:4-amino-4-deoxy-L-arabinose transferase-like glycosyltransferase
MAAAVLLAFFWRLGDVPLYDLDEGAFTEATREMLESGNFITPYRDGEPRYDKPILIYWLQAASVGLLGLNEFALRLPSALAATLWAWALYRFGRQQIEAVGAAVAVLILVNVLQVGIIAKAATADAVLNLFLALALFEVYRYAVAPSRAPRRRAYLWMGLGFLTKGPVAVFFPLVVSLVYLLSLRRFRDWLRSLFDPIGWLLFLAVVVPWHVAVYHDGGTGFFESFYLHHNLGRFEDPIHGHSGFPFYYLVALPLILLPFTGWFLRLLLECLPGWRDPLDRFLWLWFASVLVFFSFSGTQLPHYALYGASPLFLLMARYRERLLSRWLAFLPLLLLLGLLLLLPELLALVASHTRKPDVLALLEEGRRLLGGDYRLEIAVAMLGVLALSLWRRVSVWEGLLLAGFVQTAVVSAVVVPRVLDTLQGPVKEAALLARESGRATVVYRTSLPSFSVYRQAITPTREPHPGELVFMRVDKLERFARDFPNLPFQVIYRRGAVILLQLDQEGAGG